MYEDTIIRLSGKSTKIAIESQAYC
jgi:hypothetical protein